TIMASVPRLYEGIHARIQEEMAKRPPREQKLFRWALDAGARYNGPRALGKTPGIVTRAEYALADRLVLSKLRKKVVGSRLRYFISGGAPLSNDTARFFSAAGWEILQGYGLTETAPVITVNRPELNKMGKVGSPVPGVA